MKLRHYKLTSGQEIIANVVEETNLNVRVNNVYMIITLRGTDSLTYQSMMPWTTQNFNEDLREVVIYKSGIIAMYHPSERTIEEYFEQLRERKEFQDRKSPYLDSDEELDDWHSQFDVPDSIN
jgi:hypothetical protein